MVVVGSVEPQPEQEGPQPQLPLLLHPQGEGELLGVEGRKERRMSVGESRIE